MGQLDQGSSIDRDMSAEAARRLERQLNAWRDKLMALDRRQRLLYFKHTKSGSLEIAAPVAEQVLKALADGEMVVRAQSDIDEESGPGARTLVVTDKTGDTLRTALRRIDQASQQSYADRGIWTLHLGVGMLRWIDIDAPRPRTSAKDGADPNAPLPEASSVAEEPKPGPVVVDSPLLLIPVRLKRTGADSPYVVSRTEDDITVNPALKLKMEEFGIAVPDVDPDGLNSGDVVADVMRAIEGREGWEFVHRIVCTNFTFHKEAIYRDLTANAAAVAANPMVQLLALGPDSPSAGEFGFDPPDLDMLDKSYPPENMFSVLDADSSQRRCIIEAANGRSFVMDGPPGTGKSQTIANMIVEIMTSGRTVLFVSEKAAALDVVRDRIRATGLGHLLLELHSHSATRKHVAEAFAAALTSRASAARTFKDSDAERLTRTRTELNDFADAMNEIRKPLEASLFTVLGRLAQLDQHVDASVIPEQSWRDLTPSSWAGLKDRAARLGAHWHVAERGDDYLWQGLARDDASAPEARDMKRVVQRAWECAQDLATRIDTVDEQTGLTFSRDTSGIRRRIDLLKLLDDRVGTPWAWLSMHSLDPLVRRVSTARAATQSIRERTASLEQTVGSRWNEIDTERRVLLEEANKSSIVDRTSTPIEIAQSIEALDKLRPVLEAVLADANHLASLLGLGTEGIDLKRADNIAELGHLGGAVDRPPRQWFNAALQNQVAECIDTTQQLVNDVLQQQESLKDVFTPGALDLDLASLAVRFRDRHKGFGKLSKAARADKKKLQAVTVSGKAGKAVTARLEDAASWQQAVRRLSEAEPVRGPILGSLYRETATDFNRLRSALDTARRAVQLAGADVDSNRLTEQLSSEGTPDAALVLIADRLQGALANWKSMIPSLPGSFSTISTTTSVEEQIVAIKSEIAAAGPVLDLLHYVSSVAQRPVPLGEATSIFDAVDDVRVSIACLGAEADFDEQHFGSELTVDTDYDALERQLSWADRVLETVGKPLPHSAAAKLPFVAVSARDLEKVEERAAACNDQVRELFSDSRQRWLTSELSFEIDASVELLQDLCNTAVPDIENWCIYQRERNWAESAGFQPVLESLEAERRSPVEVAHSLEYAALERWVDEIVREDYRLREYRSDDRDELVAMFKELDRALIGSAYADVIRICNDRVPKSLTSKPAQVIVREAQKKTRHKPVRQLLQEVGTLAQQLKPCFMMSPLSVSQYLPSGMKFDVVIFDEASQVLPSDAINCVYRGQQLIVAGDQKQLPPTDFFATGVDDTEDDEDETDVFDSVLDLAKGAGGLTSLPLNWHYRSRHEDLITYSNYRFYKGALYTFPSAVFDAPDLGVELIHVDGVYRRGTTRDNPVEAAKVVERVLYFVTQHPEESIGVVTFSSAQADAVMAEMERQSAEHPALAGLLSDHDRLDGFFVKSLENVQGDERDVILFSLGYGPDENGKFTMNFGPLNREGGWKRLNVAITRARKRVEVIASFRAGDMSGLTNEGVRHLKNYLDFAERGAKALALDLEESAGDAESPFEEQVIDVIRGWGYDVVPQVGVAGYRIDMAVRHPDRPGSYAIGIECDGAAYHSAKTARDRDRLRESVLRGLGWEIHRIWGLSWWRDRSGQEERLRHAIERAIDNSGDLVLPAAVTVGTPAIEFEEVSFEERPTWTVDYTMVGPPRTLRRDPKTPEGIHDVREYFAQVIEAEAPVHREVLYDRFRQAWGAQRIGSAMKRSLDRALDGVMINGMNCSPGDDDVCRMPGKRLESVRVPAAGQPLRRVALVPKEELEMAVVKLVEDAHSLDQTTLAQNVAALFGWKRTRDEVRTATELCVQRLLGRGLLVEDEDAVLRRP